MEDKWLCPECGEIREDDARVEGNMKCGQCSYGFGEPACEDGDARRGEE